ncbi:MAG: hypothetical protein HY548_09365 [Elusimicrobia bacterium]|nr:hypothetical protein [Elusimicrobiota bacterium]
MSRRKPYNEYAGYVCSRRNQINGGWVVIYKAEEAGLDPAGGPWVAVCETHKTVCNTASLPKARPFLKIPEFCEECMSQYAGKTEQLKGGPNHA